MESIYKSEQLEFTDTEQKLMKQAVNLTASSPLFSVENHPASKPP